MFPISDDNSDRKIFPYVNIAIIILNILVFVLLQQLATNDTFTNAFSLVPKEITSGVDLQGLQTFKDSLGRVYVDERGQPISITLYETPVSVYLTLLTSMFMHGSIMHIFGNMLYLWIFGDNIENRLGHLRYAVFYLVCGLAAAFSQVFMDINSTTPMLGASGAISGVLGGYVLLYPNRRVTALLFNFLTSVPAWIALGIWIGYQIISGYFTPAGTGGVAYAAHIGGFLGGLLLIKVFAIGTRD